MLIILSMGEDPKNNESPGIDGLSYELLKNTSHILSRYLCGLFNSILTNVMYPDMWCEPII